MRCQEKIIHFLKNKLTDVLISELTPIGKEIKKL